MTIVHHGVRTVDLEIKSIIRFNISEIVQLAIMLGGIEKQIIKYIKAILHVLYNYRQRSSTTNELNSILVILPRMTEYPSG